MDRGCRERWHNGLAPTDYNFTAQRLDGFGLLDYHARYYDATLGRFISPDTVVPDYANPQDLNRYSYVRGNPVRFTDPSGHALECGIAIEDCGTPMDGETVVAIYRAHQQRAMFESLIESVKNTPPQTYIDSVKKVWASTDKTVSVNFSAGASGFGQEYLFNFGLINFDEKGNFAFGTFTFGWGANTTWGGGLGGDVTVANTSDLSKLAGTSTNQGLVLPAGRFSANLDYVRMKGGYEGFSASGLYGLDIPTPAQAAKLVELLDFDPTDYGVHGNISGTANFAFLARVVNPDGTRSWKVWTSLQVFDETAQ